MSKFTKRPVKENGIYRNVYEETLQTPTTDKKFRNRAMIDEKVFDIHDSVADTAKWCSALTVAVTILYNVLDEESVKRMSPEQKALIDSLVKSLEENTTRFQSQYNEEGESLVYKILERQGEVNKILK